MAIHGHILHNGSIHEASEPLLLAGQAGLLAGWVSSARCASKMA